MSTSTLVAPAERTDGFVVTAARRLGDYIELTKPKIALLELVTVAVAAWLAGWQPWLLLHALVGTALVAASASVLNQWLERSTDRRMPRTADRPLAAGRISSGEALVIGAGLFPVGAVYLALAVNPTTALLGALSWVLYVLIYTPLKTRSPINTFVGAIAGALPILMGWTAMGGPLDLRAAALFLIVFLWQFPHFMAIAWIYRREYGAAGMKMLSVVDPTGRRPGAQAVLAALALLPVTMVPALLPLAGSVYIYATGALLLTGGQLAVAIWFSLARDDASARALLRASLVYLPTLLLLLTLVHP